MKIAFCGFGRAGQEVLCQLLTSYEIPVSDLLVFTHDGCDNEGFLTFLQNLSIVFSTENINSQVTRVEQFQPDYLISAYYRYIVRDHILRLVGMRAMNLHPSLLPDYKGCFSGCWAIINGEEQTGISFHYMTEKVDAGNIILQVPVKILPGMVAFDLYHRQVSAFVSAFGSAARLFFSSIVGTPQKQDVGRYYPRQLPFNGVIDADLFSFAAAERFVRAMNFPPFEPARIRHLGEEVQIPTVDELARYSHWFTK